MTRIRRELTDHLTLAASSLFPWHGNWFHYLWIVRIPQAGTLGMGNLPATLIAFPARTRFRRKSWQLRTYKSSLP